MDIGYGESGTLRYERIDLGVCAKKLEIFVVLKRTRFFYDLGCLSTTKKYLPGTMFHMDLGFFRGPSNLTSVVRDSAVPAGPTIIKSIEGHTAYLSIVDAATRYLWVSPLKNKHPPIALINKQSRRTISMDPAGHLSQSQMCKHMCDRNGFEYQPTSNEELAPTMEALLANLPEQHRVIRTYGGR
jgi:hypothetical protein